MVVSLRDVPIRSTRYTVLCLILNISSSTTQMEGGDYKVADISQHEWGRKEISLAEIEMPGLLACRAEFGPQQILKGAKISGSLRNMCVATDKEESE